MDKMCEDLNEVYGVSLAKSTISKWENGKAEPTLAYARILSKYFNVTLDYVIGISDNSDPRSFTTAKEATAYLLKLPSMAAFGGYDIKEKSDEEIIEFANELLYQFELVSRKYKK